MGAGYVDLDEENVDQHHLCCALGDRKHAEGVERKRAWLKRRFGEGLVFRKLDVRGKVFIEYAPAEVAWRPIIAPGWLVVHCLWVSGRYAGQGHGRRLVESALEDAERRGRAGLVIAAADRKRPFLSDPKFLRHLGFEVIDRAGPFRLHARAVGEGAEVPRFASSVTEPEEATGGRFLARYTDQCPYNLHWAAQMAEQIRQAGHEVTTEQITTCDGAQYVSSPLGAFGLERDGTLVTHHLNTDNATRRLLDRLPG
jgi:GNAT superfamily N-acetyltransferase